ncbi:DNA-processing protein DprA [Chamaesiphon minutus]|uniref:Putative Rossmann fold nucleotide-binding protein involved in DNA uptake n=1 Tax=Chamaesiphon minutus (strain ATCC 27169 / PCC 6605) TaxID=1173020 RepID=K9UB06_CHAP6|nr:DNA-processing protein DprA [Chamaesiphon minutus]AFY92267.1 putative Rossmann fold nucleotide-binding protein involved in DNA uptake [Chamaesiphon minutus PCC 6605]
MSSHHLTPDTQAILLLCASLGNSRDTYPQPLNLGEYHSLAKWLVTQKLRPADLLESSGQNLLQTCDLFNLDRLESLLARGMMLALAVEKWTSKGLWIVGRGDPDYPDRLRQKLGSHAPAFLYGVGDIRLLSQGGLAIVGSRNIDEEGIEYTSGVADNCARQGIQIVSGGARGVDTTAMLAAIAAGGNAVGILADSLAKAAVSGKYRSAIQEQRLTLVSAVDPQAGFNVGNAMGRNKYIYALSNYGLVVNADYNKGGTWAGAVELLKSEKSIPLFVKTDGKISPGNKQLIQLGANEFPPAPWHHNLEQRLQATIDAKTVKTEAIQCSLSFDGIDSPKNSADVEPIDSKVAKTTSPTNIYEAVLPLILSSLQQPADVKSLAAQLDVNHTQLQNWLKKAVDDGRVTKTTKPVKYVSKVRS